MQPACLCNRRSQPTHGNGMINDGPIPRSLLRERSKFMKLVRDYNDGEVYDRFKHIIQDYAEQRSDVAGTMGSIEQLLLDDHSEICQGLISLGMQLKASNFAIKLQDRLAFNDKKRYLDYLEILQGFRSGQKSMAKMVEELAVLFANGHKDLFVDFCGFLPDGFVSSNRVRNNGHGNETCTNYLILLLFLLTLLLVATQMVCRAYEECV